MVIIGHVDAGKSTLMGNYLCKLGLIDMHRHSKTEKYAENLGKSSFALAMIMDEDEEERKRGVTINTTQKYFEIKEKAILL